MCLKCSHCIPHRVVEVYYDSMPSYSAHSSALTRQVASVVQTPHAELELRHVDVQVARRVALFFKQTQMRSHLLMC